MNYKQYYIETESAGNTDLDHINDVRCQVYKQAPDNSQKKVEIGQFIITGNEIRDYGSLDTAIIAYMHRDYPDNNPSDEERYRKMQEQEAQLQADQKALLIDILNRNGGRITSYPVPDEDGGVEYPITMAFYGKHGNPNISITDVYLNEHDEPYVDGIDEEIGSVERGFQVYPEHVSWALDFLTIALGFKKTEIKNKSSNNN